jgi:putative transcriptional regulator
MINLGHGKESPTTEQVKSVRVSAGLTQTAAAALLYKRVRHWQKWESGENKMDPVFWEFFLLKLPLHS